MDTPQTLICNGQPVQWAGGNLLDFLSAQGFTPPFAVAINRLFIPKARYLQTQLHEGDDIEIVRAVTGG